MNLNKLVTLIIPTANRAQFIERLIRYYSNTEFSGKIIVGDSSKQPEQQLVEQCLAKYQQKLNLKLIKFSADVSHPEKSVNMAAHIDTPYAVIGADDDFVLVSGIEKGIDFLSSSPDYDTAHGEMLIFSMDTAFGNVETFNSYPTRSNEHDDPILRVNQQFCEFYTSNFYAVRRSELLIRKLQAMWMVDNDRKLSTLSEPVAEAMTVISAKVKKLDCPFGVRQYCPPLALATRPDEIDWILSPDFHTKFPVFEKLVSFELDKKLRSKGVVIEYRGLTDFVRKSFSFFISRNLIQYSTGNDPFPKPADCAVNSYTTAALLAEESKWRSELFSVLQVIKF